MATNISETLPSCPKCSAPNFDGYCTVCDYDAMGDYFECPECHNLFYDVSRHPFRLCIDCGYRRCYWCNEPINDDLICINECCVPCPNCGLDNAECECEFTEEPEEPEEPVPGEDEVIHCPRCGMFGYTLKYGCDNYECGYMGMGWFKQYRTSPMYNIVGTCSTDIDVLYVSVVDKKYQLPEISESLLLNELYDPNILSSTIIKSYDFTKICPTCWDTADKRPTCSTCQGSGIVPGEKGSFDLYLYRDEKLSENGESYIDETSKIVVWGNTNTTADIVIESVTCRESDTAFDECLSGDTLITMADGTYKRMDELRVGDIVLSREKSPVKVLQIGRGKFNPNHILYTFEDGTIIDETNDHRFFNVDQGFYQRLKQWKIGDRAVNQNDGYVALVSVEQIDEEAEMFGIYTEDGTYFANGLLSGYATCNEPMLATATADQIVDMLMSVEEYELAKLLGFGGILP